MYLPFKQRTMKLRSNPPTNELYCFYIIQLLPEEIESFFRELNQKFALDYLLIRFEFIGNPNQYLRDRIRTCMLRINPSIHIAWMDKYCIISNTIISNPRHIPLADIRSNRDSIVVTMRGFRVLYIPQLLREESIYNSNADIIIIGEGESNGLNIPSNWESVQYSIEDGGQRCLVRNDSIYYPNSDDWISIYPDIGLTVINFPDLRLYHIREAHYRVPCIQRTRRLMRLRQPGTIHCSRNHKAPLSTV